MHPPLPALGLVLLVVCTSKFSVEAKANCNSDAPDDSDTARLRRRLLCNYDKTVRPTDNHTSTTSVLVTLFPQSIDFYDRGNILKLHAWMSLEWYDDYLSWKRADFGDLKFMPVRSDEIWMPPLSIYNSVEMGNDGIHTTNCLVHFMGAVVCVPMVQYSVSCVSNYQDWPFDRHNCTILLGSWTHKKEEINYHTMEKEIYMHPAKILFDFVPSSEWRLLSLTTDTRIDGLTESNYTFPTIMYNVIIERHSNLMQVTIIAPAVLLIIVTLTVLWLNPNYPERLIVAVLNLICHLICISDVIWQVPFNGSSTPSILFFHQSSMIAATFALLLTVVLRQLGEISASTPVWLETTTSTILESRAGQLILLTILRPKASRSLGAEEANAGSADAKVFSDNVYSEKSNVWQNLATILDRLSFIIVLFTYLIMICVLAPRNDILSVPEMTPS
ncbi:neuronal acetylcholine receptor subunit beta-3-like [Diprion similis]|uniref:neuronal acetylcholine receptor subunit beta-3-like n=1 Tax=Diprion similis TaxID=362088 RepID=UPI001EF81971|nr:neuronal acetylcholine receptor subunit beta-3-like [Diprion similis]XP_046748858.1 neuronal acetylcholine receptor subunit beta-3-like [Diprion similis]